MPAVLLLGLVVRCIWVFVNDNVQQSDFLWYFQRGADIAQGRGFISSSGAPTASQPIGYPALLGVVFALTRTPTPLIGELVNIGLSLLTILLSERVGAKLFRSRAIGRTTALGLAIYPNYVAHCALLSSEILASFLLVAGVYLLLEEGWGPMALAGVAFGALVHVKPQAVLLPVILCALLSKAPGVSRRLGRCAAVGALTALTLVPWTLRNERAFGEFVWVSNNGGINLLIGNNPRSTGGWSDIESQFDALRRRGATTERALDRAARASAIAYIRAEPLRTVARWPLKVKRLFESDDDGFVYTEEGLEGRPTRPVFKVFRALSNTLFYVMLAAASVSVVERLRARRPGWRRTGVGIVLVGYFAAVSMVFFGVPRFHLVLIPWILLHAADLAWKPQVLTGLVRRVVRS